MTGEHWPCVCSSPALVDVDAVDFVSTDGNLGESFNHVVALQDDVALRGQPDRHKDRQNESTP